MALSLCFGSLHPVYSRYFTKSLISESNYASSKIMYFWLKPEETWVFRRLPLRTPTEHECHTSNTRNLQSSTPPMRGWPSTHIIIKYYMGVYYYIHIHTTTHSDINGFIMAKIMICHWKQHIHMHISKSLLLVCLPVQEVNVYARIHLIHQ